MLTRKLRNLFALSAAAVLFAAAQSAMAATINYVYVQDAADLTSSRTEGVGSPDGLEVTDWDTVTISWVIQPVGNLWSYKYTFSSDTPALSHFIIGLSSENTVIREEGTNNTSPDGQGSYTSANGNPSLPGTLVGAKFQGSDNTTAVISFVTAVAPVWGSFYAKGGNTENAFNTGLLTKQFAETTDASFNKMLWIPTPDTLTTVVPLPAAAWSGLAALAAIGATGKLRKKLRAD